ncbi:hypothetical protein N8697_00910 [bacterium]|nr:hypothetical protein [bacterium]
MKLHKNAPKDLLVLDESEWTEFDKKIWDNFDEETQSGPNPSPVAIGRLNEKNVLLSRIHAFSKDGGFVKPSDNNSFSVFLTVFTESFFYEKNDGNLKLSQFEKDYPIQVDYIELGEVFEYDGDYNLLEDDIPTELECSIEEIFSYASVDYVLEYLQIDYGNTLVVNSIKDVFSKEQFEKFLKSKLTARITVELKNKFDVSIDLKEKNWDKVKQSEVLTIDRTKESEYWEFNKIKDGSLVVKHGTDSSIIFEGSIYDCKIDEYVCDPNEKSTKQETSDLKLRMPSSGSPIFGDIDELLSE